MAFTDGIVDAIDPARLRLLVEVGRRGSISAAAEACRIGQPSATKHLKTLEAAIGEKLVQRNGRSSQLTEAGEVDLPDGVAAEPFLEDELIGIAAPGRLRLRRGRARIDDLRGATLLVR